MPIIQSPTGLINTDPLGSFTIRRGASGQLAGHVVANPSAFDGLTPMDIAIRFGVSEYVARRAMYLAAQDLGPLGWTVCERMASNGWVYELTNDLGTYRKSTAVRKHIVLAELGKMQGKCQALAPGQVTVFDDVITALESDLVEIEALP